MDKWHHLPPRARANKAIHGNPDSHLGSLLNVNGMHQVSPSFGHRERLSIQYDNVLWCSNGSSWHHLSYSSPAFRVRPSRNISNSDRVDCFFGVLSGSSTDLYSDSQNLSLPILNPFLRLFRAPPESLKALPLVAGVKDYAGKIDRSIVKFPIVFGTLIPGELDVALTGGNW